MDISLLDIIISVIGGFVAGGINTLAGFGSIITLSIYTEILGLPLVMANGTNRVNVFSNTSMASYVFYKNGKLDLKNHSLTIVIIFIFSIIGVYIAANISNEDFKSVFKYLLLFLLPIIIINPKRWIIKTDQKRKLPKVYIVLMAIFLGLYGGFIQMGMGLLFLLVFVLFSKINIIESNALKVTIVSIYTIVLIFIFHFKGLIHWPFGLMVAVGQGLGGWLTAKYASRYKYADKMAYIVLVMVVILANVKYWFY